MNACSPRTARTTSPKEGTALALIGLVMDEVHRAPRNGGGNCLTLVKFRKRHPHD
jgi:anti-sigma regulatory factor (Ser/Thr protein kinase)